jgi:hypothetical protein
MLSLRRELMMAGVLAAVMSQGFVVSAEAACATPVPVSASDVDGFKASPERLLANNAGGAAIISAVRGLAASDAATVGNIIALAQAAGTNRDQVGAIGTGLAQAAQLCIRTESQTAQAIQKAVVESNNEALITAFRATTGDLPTLAVGASGGAAGGGGPGGSGVLGGGLSGQTGTRALGASTGSSYANAGFAFSTVGANVSTIPTNTRTLSALSASVSPAGSR